MGANKLSITGDLALGATNKMTITGSGTVTGDGNESITVKEIDASGVSGVVTLATLEASEVGTVTTGSGADVLTHTAGAADFTVTTGAGNDQLTLAAAGVGSNSLVLDMGTGTDTLVFADTQLLTTNATNTHSVSGVDKLSYAGAFTIDSTVINNATWEISESATATDNLTVTVLAADTAIDVSGLTVTTANAASVALDTIVIDASGAGVDGVSSIKGSLINKNTITANDLDATTIVGGGFADALTGANKVDNITGGAGIDTINGDAGNDTLTGGAGADIFLVGAGAAGSNDTITDFVVGATNDDIHISNGAMEIASGTTGQWSNLDDWADVATADTMTYQTITGAFDLTGATANTNILVLNGADVANAAAAETALETGGAYALTIKGTLAAVDIFALMYDNGVDSFFAAVQSTAGVADNALPAAGDLTVTHLLTFSGITDCSTIVAAQYADIIT
jgi:Ca2+-binding RTX toxin-like protein